MWIPHHFLGTSIYFVQIITSIYSKSGGVCSPSIILSCAIPTFFSFPFPLSFLPYVCFNKINNMCIYKGQKYIYIFFWFFLLVWQGVKIAKPPLPVSPPLQLWRGSLGGVGRGQNKRCTTNEHFECLSQKMQAGSQQCTYVRYNIVRR